MRMLLALLIAGCASRELQHETKAFESDAYRADAYECEYRTGAQLRGKRSVFFVHCMETKGWKSQ